MREVLEQWDGARELLSTAIDALEKLDNEPPTLNDLWEDRERNRRGR